MAQGNIHRADIVAIERRAGATGQPPVQLIHLAIGDGGFHFVAGQYLEVVHPCGASIPLSIASAPARLPSLVLHYRSTPGREDAARMDELITAGDALLVRGPLGTVRVVAGEPQPLLLVTGGTGISQALSILEMLALADAERATTLVTCTDHVADVYFEDLVPVRAALEWIRIADPARGPRNRGLEWLRSHAERFTDARVIVAGGPGFVAAVVETLVDAGIPRASMESDLLAPASTLA